MLAAPAAKLGVEVDRKKIDIEKTKKHTNPNRLIAHCRALNPDIRPCPLTRCLFLSLPNYEDEIEIEFHFHNAYSLEARAVTEITIRCASNQLPPISSVETGLAPTPPCRAKYFLRFKSHAPNHLPQFPMISLRNRVKFRSP
jgi:hypothetical protein